MIELKATINKSIGDGSSVIVDLKVEAGSPNRAAYELNEVIRAIETENEDSRIEKIREVLDHVESEGLEQRHPLLEIRDIIVEGS